MPTALEIRGLYKSFAAGDGACRISALVLRALDLTVRDAECIGIVGPPGSGKSTLLLCAAGLMRYERGRMRWFGNASRFAAGLRTRYQIVGSPDARRSDGVGGPVVHLIDVAADAAPGSHLVHWIAERRALGDAVVIATRDGNLARGCGARLLGLRGGALFELEPTWDRVAERAVPH